MPKDAAVCNRLNGPYVRKTAGAAAGRGLNAWEAVERP
jgi:hypothetical protein